MKPSLQKRKLRLGGLQQPSWGMGGDPLVINGARALLLGLLVQHLLHPPAILKTAGEKNLPTVTRVRNGTQGGSLLIQFTFLLCFGFSQTAPVAPVTLQQRPHHPLHSGSEVHRWGPL